MKQQTPHIDLRPAAYETIIAATAQHLPLETGGVLLGFHEENRIVVTHALVVDENAATPSRYVRDDILANELLTSFLVQRADNDPTGYVGEWHTHPVPSKPSPTDMDALRQTAKVSGNPVALLVHMVGGAEPFVGLIAQRKKLRRVSTAEALVSSPTSRFDLLGPLPVGAVRGDGPVFISYRQSDGTAQAESLENLLRASGLVVWRDRTDLRPGTTTDRLESALTGGLSAAVLIVTPEIVDSEIVRERELPRLLQLDADPAFSLCIANKVPRSDEDSKCDYDAADRLLRLSPARTLADKKQSNVLTKAGEIEIVRDLLMHRIEQRRPEIRSENRPFTMRIQTRPTPFAIEADEEDLHLRIKAADSGRLPSNSGLEHLKRTLSLTSDAVYAAGARTVRIMGGAHLSIALAIGAALPETKIGNVEVLDLRGALWKSNSPADDPQWSTVEVELIQSRRKLGPSGRARVAIFVSLASHPDRSSFERLLNDSSETFDTAAVITINTKDQIDPREGARVGAAITQQIKQLSAIHGRAELHLAFHGPYTMAVLLGRHLNTLRTVVYEWDGDHAEYPRYVPALVLEPGVSNGPITEVVL